MQSKRTYQELLIERNQLRREVAMLKLDVSWERMHAREWQHFAWQTIEACCQELLRMDQRHRAFLAVRWQLASTLGVTLND